MGTARAGKQERLDALAADLVPEGGSDSSVGSWRGSAQAAGI